MWSEKDDISVFSKTDHNLRYDISSITNGGAFANFSYTYEYVVGTGARYSYYFGVYPWSTENKLVDNTLQMNIPAVQNYVAGNDFRYVPLVAKSATFNFSFKAPSSVLAVAINKEDMPNEFKLMSVTVSSSSVDLAGPISIDMSGTSFEAVIDPSLGDTSKAVTLDLGEGVELTTEAQYFSLALPAVVFPENDFTVTCQLMVDGEARVMKIKRDKSLSFNAGNVKRLLVTAKAESFTGGTGGDLNEDFKVEDDMIIDEPLVVPSGGDVTLTLGEGKTLGLSPTNPNSALVVIEQGATLTIDGAGAMTTVVAEPTASALSATRAASNSAFPIVVNGKLIINSGDFTLNSYATSWLNCGIYVAEGGELVINGGTFRSTNGSFILGHPLGNRPAITVHGGRFEGYDPSDNDFDGNGCNYLEPEYASYNVADDEIVVASRTTNWEVDNSILLNSILKNGGKATLVDCVDADAFFVEPGISVRHDVEVCVSGDPTKVNGTCNFYLDNAINCFANLTFTCDYNEGDLFGSDTLTPYERILYVDSLNDIANVYDGATLTLGDATYFAGTDGDFEKAFTLYGGNIVVNGGSYTLYNRVRADNMFVVDANYADSSSLLVNDGVFNGFDPERVTFDEEVKNCVPEGKGALLAWDGGHYTIKNKGTFTAASYNVDGLPEKVLSLITINGDGPGSDGTKTISSRLAGDAWDIIAFQEDFTYDSQLRSSMSNYTFGTYRGGVESISSNDTDGLGFATLNSTTSFSGETIVKFNDAYGGIADGANTCIEKGFRYYLVTLAGGAQIDVYITHMNSGSKEGHINARASQFQQLAQYIASNDNGNPVLVLGDFNARYTRDNIQTNFHNNLGAFADYLSDAWVELVDKYDINGELLYAAGEYPDYPSDSLVVTEKYEGAEGDIECTTQGGEVVDKILYINNPNSDVAIFANSFERDMDYTEADHTPVVSEFTYYY
ncbi:MAG: endonuclease/exonuclease/phosphatase family protein [Alistipes sp.]|nr:endonuclease/exonuclease/phosphatase family protein [Alistipes sp.]